MSNQPKALITGITGQSGSYLAELLLSKGYEVHGLIRRASTPNTLRIEHILNLITLHQSDITDQGSLTRLIEHIHPQEVYNLAAMSFVHASFDHPVSTGEMTALGVTRILEAIRQVDKTIKFYQASSSEIFGKVQAIPQTELTPFYPRSPYGVAKLYGHWITVNYRESYNMFCCSGILYNHESARRGQEFVTRKITQAVARIKHGLQDKLYLGNMDAKRDWGHAKDMVNAMYLMMQQPESDTYVVGTGKAHSVREFAELAFKHVGLNYQDYIEIDQRFYRPAEVDILLADPTKAKNKLGWSPMISFEELVTEMVESDLALIKPTA